MVNDIRPVRIVTLISLAFGLALYLAMRFGAFGDTMARFATAYLVVVLLILGGRTLLTESRARRE